MYDNLQEWYNWAVIMLINVYQSDISGLHSITPVDMEEYVNRDLIKYGVSRGNIFGKSQIQPLDHQPSR